MMKHVRRTALMLGLLMAAGAAWGHHSFAAFFDQDSQLLSVTGVVKDFQFRNPHGVITIAVQQDGQEIVWKAETNSPSIMRRNGWSQDSLKVGETITLEGWPARDGTKYMRLRRATRANGEMVGSRPLGYSEITQ